MDNGNLSLGRRLLITSITTDLISLDSESEAKDTVITQEG